ncbi:MAG: hypothetical protein A3K19_07775 [Lentisphaerae bacterium RIFOXYB12_FULL_65_16]|nr:MAG: hypothetical protein A3K19_07775 [Lentisphaerae bacterium RIFOXYB12_FULL_65_16]
MLVLSVACGEAVACPGCTYRYFAAAHPEFPYYALIAGLLATNCTVGWKWHADRVREWRASQTSVAPTPVRPPDT